MVTLVDYKMGNLGSLLNALDFLGVQAEVTADPQALLKAKKLILPGVGAFNAAMENLAQLGLQPALQEAVFEKKIPILGICLGMQILAAQGEENGLSSGLGWISGSVKKITSADPSLKIPHVGFNTVKVARPGQGLFADLPAEVDFYFVHSYHLACEQPQDLSSQVYYGGEALSASVQKGNIFGAQFHPEKSQRNGLVFLRNFLRLEKC